MNYTLIRKSWHLNCLNVFSTNVDIKGSEITIWKLENEAQAPEGFFYYYGS